MQFFLFFFSPSSPLPSPPLSERTRGTASSRQAEKEKRRREKEGLWRRDKGLSVSVCHLIHRPLLRPAVPSVICCHTEKKKKKNFLPQTHTSKTLRQTHNLSPRLVSHIHAIDAPTFLSTFTGAATKTRPKGPHKSTACFPHSATPSANWSLLTPTLHARLHPIAKSTLSVRAVQLWFWPVFFFPPPGNERNQTAHRPSHFLPDGPREPQEDLIDSQAKTLLK